MIEQSLEERVAYLEKNIRVLNKVTTATASALKELLYPHQTKLESLSAFLDDVLVDVCPFPPECSQAKE